MKITIKDCLELDALKTCEIAAGKRNLSNIIKTVSVMDACDINTAVEQNGIKEQLVLTSFYGMKDRDADKVKVVRELSKCGISGLVLFHTDEKDGGISSILEIADAVGLPVLIIPENSGIEYSDVIEQTMEIMLLGENFKNNLINNTIYHLLNFEKHRSFQSALKAAASSNGFQVVLISKDFNPILAIENRHHTTVAEAIKALQKRENPEAGVYSLADINGIMGYWGTITLGDEKYFLLLVDNDDKYSAVEITKLAEIIELAIGMWKYTPERDIKVEMIQALIRGNKSLAYSLKDEMNIKAGNIMSVFYAKGINTVTARNVIDDFEQKYGYEVLRIGEGEESYGIVVNTEESPDPEGNPKTSVIELYNALKEISKSIRIFHATGMNGIEGSADGFKLISETWTFVESVFPFKRVFSKYELVLVSNCINIQVQGGHVKKNYVELLEPFNKEMGENKAKQLLDTLETFVLDAGMNSSKTSQFMGIHTNTVQYRLKRINEVLGAEITGNRVIPGLTIALALKRLERVVN